MVPSAPGARGDCGSGRPHRPDASTAVFWYGQIQTEAQCRVAMDKWDLAGNIVDEMYIRGQQMLEYEPNMEGVQKNLLEKALHFYEEFAHEPVFDQRTRASSALRQCIGSRRFSDSEVGSPTRR